LGGRTPKSLRVLNEKTQPLPFPAQEEEPERPRPRSAPGGRFLFALFWMLAVLVAIVLLSVSWFRELDRRKDAEERTASAQTENRALEARLTGFEEEVAALEDDLAKARKELRPWRARTARRGDALRSTKGVIALVAPLREGYEGLGEVLITMDADRDALAAAAGALERDLAALTEYLRRTEEDKLSERELRKQATTLRGRLAALRTARVSLVGAQAQYGDAADRVDSRFEELTNAVAALRKQIEKALRR
jgi:chromosome segregation ATPase